ncbi:MAG: NAD(P)-dependent oxidoreductase [Spirulina sp. SIO3F2]|nr:NAD(P)-dependent oxidoreductase [Spirulina sp. SIO3F2]
MKLLITGASGFIGRYVVAAGLRRGHQIKALVRPSTDVSRFSWADHPQVELVRLDLQQDGDLVAALQDVDAVIHLAAVLQGDTDAQIQGTTEATAKLLTAMTTAQINRLVGISTFSVYEYWRKPENSLLDEDSALVVNPRERDGYTQAKLLQAEQFQRYGETPNGQVTILRPGMVYGRENLWHALLGAWFGSIFLRIGNQATLPLTYVENCAVAMILAAELEGAIAQTLNLVDDELPTQAAYIQALQQRTSSPNLKYISWPLMRRLAGFAWWLNQTLLGGKAKLPGILVPAKLHARFKPLRYNNQRAKTVLNWQPQYGLTEALDRSCSDADLLAISPKAEG